MSWLHELIHLVTINANDTPSGNLVLGELFVGQPLTDGALTDSGVGGGLSNRHEITSGMSVHGKLPPSRLLLDDPRATIPEWMSRFRRDGKPLRIFTALCSIRKHTAIDGNEQQRTEPRVPLHEQGFCFSRGLSLI